MITAFDVDSKNKGGFNFRTAFGEGFRACYIKLGGDNLDSTGDNVPDRYVMTSNGGYKGQMDKAVDAGFEHRGMYWVSGGTDPEASAWYYLEHRDPRATFDVFDNEKLDDGRPMSDAEASAFFRILIEQGKLTNLFQYGSRISLWNQHKWPGLESLGIKAIVADYDRDPFDNITPTTYPESLVFGHQYTSSGSAGGLSRVDLNVFKDNAFDRSDGMVMLDGPAAVDRMQAMRTNVPGTCLATVYAAYGSVPSIGPHAGQYPDAIDGWNYSEDQHPGDRNPPRGVPLYYSAVSSPRWAGDQNYLAGDITLSIGGGPNSATDWPYNGTIGICSIEQREAQTGRRYLGWAGDFLGHQVNYPGREIDMTPGELLNYDAFSATADFPEPMTVSEWMLMVARFIAPVTREAASQPTILGDEPVAIDKRQDDADTNTLVRQLLARATTGGVDVGALAKAIVAQLPASPGGGATIEDVKAALSSLTLKAQ